MKAVGLSALAAVYDGRKSGVPISLGQEAKFATVSGRRYRLLLGFDQMGNKKVGALLHLLAPDIENFRAKLLAAVNPLQVHDFGISFARSVIVPGNGRNLEAFLNEIAQSRKHFHLNPTSCQ